ncbi:SurA N-terminal domain-containing protein [Oceanicaulis sp. AH-315-P02]|nr:SurA N-terminal domain-containing protein [Robiginitomaculum sp.]MBN4047800.1 SurA N-terminal domain-containing protein [Oceanicaulis sp. AH-315-P02]
MLDAMRNSLKSPFAVVFIGLIVLSFVVWGTGDVLKGGTGDAVVIVGPEKVTVDEYAVKWRREVDYRLRESNGKFSEVEAKQQGLDQQLLDRLITEAALTAKMNELGISVSNAMVVKFARDYEAFADPFTGKFSDDQYLDTLNNAQLTPRQFEEDARADLGRQQLLSVIYDGIPSPISFTRLIMAYQQEMRQVETIFLPASSLPKTGEPTTAQLEEFFSEYSNQFMIPERRAATIVLMSATDIELEINPTEEELRAVYEFEKAKYSKVETRSWLQIQVEDQVVAELVAKRLNSGEDAADIMASLKIAGEPLLVENTEIGNSPDDQIAEAVFKAEADTSGVAEGRFKWAAWKVTAIDPGYEKSFEEVQIELKKDFTSEEVGNRLYNIMGDFEGARAEGMDIEEAAESQQLVAISLPPVDRNGGDENLQSVDIYTQNPKILEILFSLDELVESHIEETTNGDFFALTVNQVVPSRAPALDEVRNQVILAWMAEQKSKAMRELANSVKSDLDSAMAANDIVSKHSGSRLEISILNRYQPEPTIPAGLSNQLFSINIGQSAFAIAPSTGDIVVSRLQNIIPSPVISDANLMLLRSRMDQEVERDLESLFVSGLRSSYTIRQDQRLKALALGDG